MTMKQIMNRWRRAPWCKAAVKHRYIQINVLINKNQQLRKFTAIDLNLSLELWKEVTSTNLVDLSTASWLLILLTFIQSLYIYLIINLLNCYY